MLMCRLLYRRASDVRFAPGVIPGRCPGVTGNGGLAAAKVIVDQTGVAAPVCPTWRTGHTASRRVQARYYCVSRMTIDSGGRVMPCASKDAFVVPWTMVELVAFWLAAV